MCASASNVPIERRMECNIYQAVSEVAWAAREGVGCDRRGARRAAMRDMVPEERQSRRTQPPFAQRVAAARSDLLRCRSIRMTRHHSLPTPRI